MRRISTKVLDQLIDEYISFTHNKFLFQEQILQNQPIFVELDNLYVKGSINGNYSRVAGFYEKESETEIFLDKCIFTNEAADGNDIYISRYAIPKKSVKSINLDRYGSCYALALCERLNMITVGGQWMVTPPNNVIFEGIRQCRAINPLIKEANRKYKEVLEDISKAKGELDLLIDEMRSIKDIYDVISKTEEGLLAIKSKIKKQ